MKRLLVTGASGLLGSAVCAAARNEWAVCGVHHSRPAPVAGVDARCCDLRDAAEVARLVNDVRPAAVIHAAAVADPVFCENNPEVSRRVNVDAAMALAKACRNSGARFIFVSTDLVFDGQRPPYSEDDAVSPLGCYGRQKVQAEQGVLDNDAAACVCRLPLMFGAIGAAPAGFLGAMLKARDEQRPIPVFVDEYRTPLAASAAADGLLLALKQPIRGRLHLGGSERVSRRDLAVLLAQAMGLPVSLLRPCRQRDVPSVPPRPPDVSLCSARAAARGFSPPALSVQVERAVGMLKRFQEI